MRDKEATELISIGIECVLVAVLIAFIGFGLKTVYSFSDARNDQIESTKAVKQYYKFSKYDTGTHDALCDGDVYGDELIAVIREYYKDSDFQIYVNKTSETGGSLLVNSKEVSADPGKFTLSNLESIIPSLSKFHPYLVYNGKNPLDPGSYKRDASGSVTAIAFIHVSD